MKYALSNKYFDNFEWECCSLQHSYKVDEYKLKKCEFPDDLKLISHQCFLCGKSDIWANTKIIIDDASHMGIREYDNSSSLINIILII